LNRVIILFDIHTVYIEDSTSQLSIDSCIILPPVSIHRLTGKMFSLFIGNLLTAGHLFPKWNAAISDRLFC
jgi:hypothetical protein